MTGEPTRTEAEHVDRAFNLVLAAESEARQRVEACRGEAAALVAAATERARRIADLADRRMRLAHRVADQGVERAVALLLSGSPALGGEPGSGESDGRLERALAALADEILGLEPGHTP
jgi:hypothetical protein